MGAVNPEQNAVRLTAWVSGRVQGVGFRWWCRCRALELGLVGSAENLRDGRVEIIAEGPKDHCEQLLSLLRSDSSPGSVDQVVEHWSSAQGGLYGFDEK
ncbi:acylphosphatase [Amycolatopsis pithecellobii]|nr:acylphosphatase [Amycolatopsis pithecellobii]